MNIAHLASRTGRPLSFEQLDKFMGEMNPDGSGSIQFEEFCGWWTKHLARSKTSRKNRGAAGGTGLADMIDQVYLEVCYMLAAWLAGLLWPAGWVG